MAPEKRHTSSFRRVAPLQRSQALTLRRRQLKQRAQIMMSGLLVVLILLAAGGLWFMSMERRYQQRIYPNVFILGVNVGGLQPAEAEKALKDHYRLFIQVPVILNFEGKSWRVSGEELGLNMHIEESVQKAYQIGRTKDMLGNMQTIWQTFQQTVAIPVEVVVDEHQAQKSVSRLSRVIDKPATDPRIYMDGTSLAVQRGAVGRMMLVDETVARIRETLPLMSSQQVTVATRELLPRVSDAAILAARYRVDTLIGQPFSIKVNGKEFIWESADMARMLEIVQRPIPTGGGDGYHIFFNPYQIEHRIDNIAKETQTMPIYPRVAWNGGDLKIVREGTPGWRLNKQESRDIIVNSIDKGTRVVELKPRYVPIPVNEANLNTLGI